LKCPNCGKLRIAKIFWGYPADIESMKESLERKEIILGGCCVTDHDPKWECNDCNHQWGNREDDELDSKNTNSFDFDQGFNLDEVYD
jgi:hypothetical protein